ncbi:dihydroorotate dehydrogenase [candidate division GN15 bacterium]|nr:dihydroorotate dehydrogenase [candidate division GN15 bacterium]
MLRWPGVSDRRGGPVTPDLSVTIAGVSFKNPILTASGCCGYGEELAGVFSLSKLGGLVTKSITREVRQGHPPPRTAETGGGMLNAIGLANVGIERFIEEKIPFLEKQKTNIIVNVAGSKISEYVEICARLNDQPRVDMVELNISCPNVDVGGIEFGTQPTLTEDTIRRVRQVFKRPIIAKLAPNVTDISAIAQAAEQGGADALAVINSVVGMVVDPHTWRPRITNNKGGLTGPAIKPIALAAVDRVYNSPCNLPIIGIGGIATVDDMVEFLLCGATAVQIGTALFVEPDTPVKIEAGLKKYLRGKKMASVRDLVGKVRKY